MSAQRILMTAAAIADLKLPGFAHTKRGIHFRLQAENWPTVPGPRNSKLVDVENLPTDIREAILSRLTPRVAPTARAPQERDRRPVGRPRGSGFFDRHTEIADAVVAYLAAHPFPAPMVQRFIKDQGMKPVPPIHTLRRFIAKVEHERAAVLMALREPDKAKSKHRLALGRADANAAYAHEVWELDTTTGDVMTKNGRRAILGLIDRYSRRASFLVADSESAKSVRALLIRTALKWNVLPATIVVDNGSGYINQTIMTACEMLGIEHRPCPPGSPERKPFVERLFGTFSREYLPMMDGFTGHNVAQATQIRARNKKEKGRPEIIGTMTEAELQDILDNWTAGQYETRIHSGIGTTPVIKAMQSPKQARVCPDEETLKQALSAHVGTLTVGKRGLRWKNGRYWCAELAAWMGKPVHVRRVEDDLGRLLVFDDRGTFIGTAVDWERSGLSEQEFATQSRLQLQAYEKAQKAELNRLKRTFTIEKARNAVLRADAEAAGKLVTLPARAPDSAPIPAEQRPARASVHQMPPVQPQEDIAARVARAEQLIARADEGHDVPANDIAWARAFAAGPAFLAFKTQEAVARGERPIIPVINTRRKP